MRTTNFAWWCGVCNTRNTAEQDRCTNCGHRKRERHAQVHSSERAVVYYNPATGEHRTPARADTPMPAVYAQQGFERQEILNMSQWEKAAGVVHEATSFNPGNESVPVEGPAPQSRPEVVAELAKIVADANASGPWT